MCCGPRAAAPRGGTPVATIAVQGHPRRASRIRCPVVADVSVSCDSPAAGGWRLNTTAPLPMEQPSDLPGRSRPTSSAPHRVSQGREPGRCAHTPGALVASRIRTTRLHHTRLACEPASRASKVPMEPRRQVPMAPPTTPRPTGLLPGAPRATGRAPRRARGGACCQHRPCGLAPWRHRRSGCDGSAAGSLLAHPYLADYHVATLERPRGVRLLVGGSCPGGSFGAGTWDRPRRTIRPEPPDVTHGPKGRVERRRSRRVRHEGG